MQGQQDPSSLLAQVHTQEAQGWEQIPEHTTTYMQFALHFSFKDPKAFLENNHPKRSKVGLFRFSFPSHF